LNACKGHKRSVDCIAVDPTKKFVASGSYDAQVRLLKGTNILLGYKPVCQMDELIVGYIVLNRNGIFSGGADKGRLLLGADKGRIVTKKYKRLNNYSFYNSLPSAKRPQIFKCLSKQKAVCIINESIQEIIWSFVIQRYCALQTVDKS
jgi:WD40 repeat protein